MPGAPNIGTGSATCARRGGCGVVKTPGTPDFSPSCLKRAHSVLRQVTRYSVSVPLPAISGPGAGDRAALRSAREHPRGGDQVVDRHARTLSLPRRA